MGNFVLSLHFHCYQQQSVNRVPSVAARILLCHPVCFWSVVDGSYSASGAIS